MLTGRMTRNVKACLIFVFVGLQKSILAENPPVLQFLFYSQHTQPAARLVVFYVARDLLLLRTCLGHQTRHRAISTQIESKDGGGGEGQYLARLEVKSCRKQGI
jgi:hypothetical protein